MLIATWNVNSIRARLPRLLAWLQKRQPDVVCLQELKVEEAAFPFAELAAAGYHAAVCGQKTWHGVAILARSEPRAVRRGLDDDPHDSQARLIAATVDGIRIFSAYVPNGSTVGSDKYLYKRGWLTRLGRRLRLQEDLGQPLLLAGDFNIAPQERDVHNPRQWEDSVLYHPQMRQDFQELLACGLIDLGGSHLPAGTYSWWDYRQLSFPRNDGLRLDHLLATPMLTSRCTEVLVDRDERKGDTPSDHAPVLARFF
ncbi:MAG: exodeoxyribonuclease III [Desulfuromonadales bacterium]|nr:exodeoxyribonuclease III [Desulfuromonadales bacterium]